MAIAPDGYLLTNHHVVQGAAYLSVTFIDGAAVAAEVVGSDAPTDLAVRRTHSSGLPYAALGDSWRIGINRKETPILITHGPYRFLNHPIYVSQMVVLVGAACLLPTPFSLFLLVLHSICVTIKALDEEAYLRPVRARARAA